jgi:hypothetical protein
MKKSAKRRDNRRSRKRLAAIIAACAVVVVMVAVLVPRLADSDTVRIRDWHDLHRVRDDPAGSYVLVNDLDSTTPGYTELAGATANDGKGWEPIGQALFLEEGVFGERFEGTFDGRGYEIRDLFIGRFDENTVGLFGVVGGEGMIRNVGVIGANVTGHFTVGALAAMNLGTVSNSCSTGSVVGSSGVGGLLGGNAYGGTLRNSCSTADASGTMIVGGLVGMNDTGTVTDSYATGSVTRVYGGNLSFGGFVGRNREGKIINCYSTGSVHYQDGVAPADNGFAGSAVADEDYEMTDNYWDVQTSRQSSTAGDATGLTTVEMMDVATYGSWSIAVVDGPGRRNTAHIWNIVEGETYPFLSWQRRS